MGPSLIAQPLSPRAFGPSFAPVGPRLSLAGYPVWVVCPTGQDSATAMPIGLLSCLPPSARTLSGPLDGGRDRHGVARGSPPTTHFHPIKNPTDGTSASRWSIVPRNDKTWSEAHLTSPKVPRQASEHFLNPQVGWFESPGAHQVRRGFWKPSPECAGRRSGVFHPPEPIQRRSNRCCP
jgi:hypothetical protein